MKHDYDCTLWELLMRLIWLLILAMAAIFALRLIAWADTGSRGERPVEQSVWPKEVAP